MAFYIDIAGKKKRKKLLDRDKRSKAFENSAHKLALAAPYLTIPPDIEITKDYVESVANRRKYNEIYSKYFAIMAEKHGCETYNYISDRIRDCYTIWSFDVYELNRVKDLRQVYLCHSKFCSNCQRILQAFRLKRYEPVMEKLKKDYDLYHLVLTIPNVAGSLLTSAISRMTSSYTKLMRYFNGESKISGVDFMQYGYFGALRNLECTIKAESFHPHLHCILVLKQGLKLDKIHTNQYSYDRGVYKRSFTDLEILFQKLWELVYSGIKVTGERLKSIDVGYSCTCDLVEGAEWHEAFKYATKLTKDDNNQEVMTEEQFEYMYFALHRRRIMQGYGCFYKIANDNVIDTEVSELYKLMIGQLRLLEQPITMHCKLDDLVIGFYNSKYRYTIISKLTVQRYLYDLQEVHDD